MLAYLIYELLLISKSGEGVVVGLAKELHTAGLRESAEAVEDLRCIAVELLDGRT